MELMISEFSKEKNLFTDDFQLLSSDLKELADAFSDGFSSTDFDSDSYLESDTEPSEEEMLSEGQRKAARAASEASVQAVLGDEKVRGPHDHLESDLKALKDKKDKYNQVQSQYRQMIQYSKKQVLYTEIRIKAEFNKLYLFLKEEEESRLAALTEEEEQKTQTLKKEMEKIQEMSPQHGSIVANEEELQMDTVLAFLNSCKGSWSRVQYSQSEPQLVPGALIDVAKHLGNLSFAVWQKMKDQVHFHPIILDPNTAKSSVCMSLDLNSFGINKTPQQQDPVCNADGETKFISILGSEGFSSGQHSWEVEVPGWAPWAIGVARESADKNEEMTLTPERGFWCLANRLQSDEAYVDGYGETVNVKKSLERVRVQLDIDRGEMSFYDAADMTHVYTYVDTFTEKVFPYFNLVATRDPENVRISICEQDFSVMLGKDVEQ